MGKALEQWQIDLNLCVDLYQDWSAPLGSVERPLSPAVRRGYQALDYLICMGPGCYGQLSFDGAREPGWEIVKALPLFGLDRYADDLQRVYAKHSDPVDIEDALTMVSRDFDGRLECEAAVAENMRGRARQHIAVTNSALK